MDSRTGVYVITCIPTGKQYVGSTTRGFSQRWHKHRWSLRRESHACVPLQYAWNKYGESEFAFDVLECCPPEQCIPQEQYYIDLLQPALNVNRVAGSSLGRKCNQETRAKIGQANRGKIHSAESRENHRRAAISRWRDPVAGKHMREALRRTWEHRDKQAQADAIARWWSEDPTRARETLEHIRQAFIAKRSQWAKDWESCRQCATTERKHVGLGFCSTCYARYRRGVAPLDSDHPKQERLTPIRWARDWDACRGCGKTEQLHTSHGYCRRCGSQVRRGRPIHL